MLQAIRVPEMLYEEVVEVKERLVLHTSRCQINKKCSVEKGKTNAEVGCSFYNELL